MSLDHPPDALPPGYRLGQHEILRVLGRGGFAYTYQARKVGGSGEMVAIKELFPAATATRTRDFRIQPRSEHHAEDFAIATRMFHTEAARICTINHPNIVRGLAHFQANNTEYLVMRYVSGRSLRESLRDRAGFQPTPETLPPFFAHLLDALQTLHSKGIFHCDIKPANIFLGVGYEPILIDLGSSRKHSDNSDTTYSRNFSPIEQSDENCGHIGPWTDIYQLAAVIYRCVSGGKLPDAQDRAASPIDLLVPLAELPASAPYPKDFIAAIDRGLRLLPQDRPRSIADWKQQLGTTPHPRQPPPPRERNSQQPAPKRHIPNATPSHTQGTMPLVAALLIALLIIALALLFRS